jgi:putative ABC transport system permease protein
MRSYVKLALKVLTRRKFFTFISLFGISLTLVVLVVATAMLDDLFSARGAESRFDRAVVLYRVVQYGPGATMTVNPGYKLLRDYVFTLPDVERVTAFSSPISRTIYRGTERVETRMRQTDANYWKVLTFRFLEGRPFTADEESRGAFVAVITDELRHKLFAGARAVGRTVEIDGQRFAVIGVVRAESQTRRNGYGDLWVPLTTAKSSAYREELLGNFNAVVLLKDAADRERVQRHFSALAARIPVTGKEFTGFRATLDSPFEAFANDILGGTSFKNSASTVMRVILASLAVMFMVLPALNLVTINLSRILERASEIGVRKAFGAGRFSLVGQFVLENVILTLIGGLCAFVLASFFIVWLNGSGMIPHAELALNPRVFAYGMLVAAFFGLMSGAYPAWRMSRLDPVTALRGGVA